MADKHDHYVRFYFNMAISCLIPPKPCRASEDVSDNDWEERCLERLRSNVNAVLRESGFYGSYRKHTLIDGALWVYTAEFVVYTLHRFPAVQSYSPRNKCQFAIKKGPFTKAKSDFLNKIRYSLETEYIVNHVTYSYAASRFFVFEVYLGGILHIKHLISAGAVSDAGGTVGQAIEDFNNEVVEQLEYVSWNVEPLTTGRRPKDNTFKFDISTKKLMQFGENEVHGELELIEKDMYDPLEIFVDCDDSSLTDRISDERGMLNDEVAHYDVSALTCNFVDYEEDLFDCGENLYQVAKDKDL